MALAGNVELVHGEMAANGAKRQHAQCWRV